MTSELKELERQRKEVQARIWEIEEAEEERRSAAAVGRCYKYRNSYGSGDSWWLYFRAERADGRYLVGPQFEVRSGYGGEYCLTADGHVHNHLDGYSEISEAEYGKELSSFLADLTKVLSCPASGIEAPSGGETHSGSTVGKSPTGNAGDAQ